MTDGGCQRNTEIQKYICHQAFTQSIQSTSRGTPHTSACTVQDSPPPQRRSALRTIVIIVIIVIILCTRAQQGHQTSGSCSQHIHQGAGVQHGATRGHHSRSRGGASGRPLALTTPWPSSRWLPPTCRWGQSAASGRPGYCPNCAMALEPGAAATPQKCWSLLPTGVARYFWGRHTRCRARSCKRRWAGAACASGCGTTNVECFE